MLRAVLLSLTAESTYPILGTLGRPGQAWFLRQITREHPALAQWLHDDKGLKPYTVSTLLDDNGRPLPVGAWLKTGDTCWLRITTLNDALASALESVLKRLPKRLTIYKMDFSVDGVAATRVEHPWAGERSFASIAQEVSEASANSPVRMEFASPTAFRTNRLDISLPVPGQVFRSLWARWNAFCPEAMQVQQIWPEFADECIFVNELTAVNTVFWEFAERTRGAATGFTGTVGFFLPSPKKLPEKWQPYTEGADVVLQSLGRFAFFAGVGHHTTIGMGQARVLTPPMPGLLQHKPARQRW